MYRPSSRVSRSLTSFGMTARGSDAAQTPSLSQLVSSEEITQLKASGLVGIGAVNRVVLNVARPLLADRPFLGVGRIGGAHKLAQIGDGVFLFQREHYDWSARHEIGE